MSEYLSDYQVALEAAGAKVLAFEMFGDYQGSWFAKVEHAGSVVWVSGYFGSCSGCDSFADAFEYGSDKCESHRYGPSDSTCAECAVAASVHAAKLADFGRDLLSEPMTQAEAEACAVERDEWNEEKLMLPFVANNRIEESPAEVPA